MGEPTATALAARGPGAWGRVIVHADMDAFFAAVEELDEPSLRGRPVLVGSAGPRSVVATANYVARTFGVGSAMPMATARRRCPDAIIRPVRFARYQEISRAVMAIFARFTPLLSPLGLDEACLDCTAVAADWPGPGELGAALKAEVFAATGLRVSVGVADTRFVAKVASDHQKPDGLTVVPPAEAIAFLAPLPVRKLWGAGPKTAERLQALGLHTIADVARADPTELARHLGSAGPHFWNLAHNRDPRPVVVDHTRKSLGAERTLMTDVTGAVAVAPHLHHAAEEVSGRLAAKGLRARGVRVKLKTAGFIIQSRQTRLPQAVNSLDALYTAGLALLAQFDLSVPLRLVGLTAYDLEPEGTPANRADASIQGPIQLWLPGW